MGMDYDKIQAELRTVKDFTDDFSELCKKHKVGPGVLCLFLATRYERVARKYPADMEQAERLVQSALRDEAWPSLQ